MYSMNIPFKLSLFIVCTKQVIYYTRRNWIVIWVGLKRLMDEVYFLLKSLNHICHAIVCIMDNMLRNI